MLIRVVVQLILVCRCTFIIIVNNIAKHHNTANLAVCASRLVVRSAFSPTSAKSFQSRDQSRLPVCPERLSGARRGCETGWRTARLRWSAVLNGR